MRLTIEQDRETIKRYGYIKPARPGSPACAALCPGTSRHCTLEKGHRGPHVAHGMFRRVLAVWWDTDDQVPEVQEKGRRPIQVKARHAIQTGKMPGALEGLLRGFVRLASSVEEIGFLVLFVAMVGFVLYWMSLILR